MSAEQQNSNTNNSKFLKGTMILTITSIIVKVIGSLNWIILSRVLGGEGDYCVLSRCARGYLHHYLGKAGQ